MPLAIGLFVFGLSVSAGAAWIAPWQVASFQFMSYAHLDAEMVTQQVRGRIFTRSWLLSAIIGSSLMSMAALVPESAMFIPLFAGVIVIVSFAWAQGFRLFREAVVQLGIEWPPKERG